VTTKYITEGFDLEGRSGYRLCVSQDGKGLELADNVYIVGNATTSGSKRFAIEQLKINLKG